MDIEFATTKLQKLCQSQKAVEKRLGQPDARKLMTRLGEFAAADTLQVIQKLPQAELHQLKADREGQWAVTIHGGRRLVFEIPDPVPRKIDGGVDLSQVTGIRVILVGDYH